MVLRENWTDVPGQASLLSLLDDGSLAAAEISRREPQQLTGRIETALRSLLVEQPHHRGRHVVAQVLAVDLIGTRKHPLHVLTSIGGRGAVGVVDMQGPVAAPLVPGRDGLSPTMLRSRDVESQRLARLQNKSQDVVRSDRHVALLVRVAGVVDDARGVDGVARDDCNHVHILAIC